MQESILNLRLKKWTDATKVLSDNTDSLSSQEQNAVNTLKNLWRSAQFSAATTRRVERMVKLLSDSDKLHGNNRDIVQASKDFRGVAREMYTSDAETFRQFADAMQKTVGGPRMTDRQQTRRSVTATTQSNRHSPHNRSTTTYRPAASSKPTTQSASTRQNRQPQPPRRQSVLQPFVSHLATVWPTITAVAVLIVVIGLGIWTAWSKSTTIQPYDYAKLLRDTWNGEMVGLPATLIIDSISNNQGEHTVQARFFVRKKSEVRKDSLTGHLDVQREGCYVYLSKPVNNDSLTDTYRLFIARDGISLCGNVISADGRAKTINLNNGGKGVMSQVSLAGAPQYVLDPMFADSATCYRAVLKDTAWTVKDYSKTKVFPRGLLIDSCKLPKSTEYNVVFVNNGRYYQVNKSHLKWSGTNPNSLPVALKSSVVRQHSDIGVFFSTLWPCWLVIGLVGLPLLFTIILPLLLSRFEPIRRFLAVVCRAMVIVMPICLLLVALIEIADYQLFGSQAFWWCDKDRYGFLGSVLRIIPFLLVVIAQVASIWWYEGILFFGERDESKKIHMKPAVISFVVSIPVVIVFLLVAQMAFGWKGKDAELTAVAIFFAILLTGIIITLVKNVRELGTLRGTLITLFVLVYIVGCMVAIGGLVVAILEVLVPLLCALFGLAILGGGLLGGGRGETLYKDKYGNLYRRVN